MHCTPPRAHTRHVARMKTSRLLALLTVSSLMLFCSNLTADDNGEGQGDGEDQGDNCQGGHIEGSETLIASVDLIATSNAPAGAGGFARLISDNEDGTVTSSLSLVISNLDADTYILVIVKKSD